MATNRRRFLESAAANAAAFAMMPAAALASIPRESSTHPAASPEGWNLSWTDNLKGKRSAVFDWNPVLSEGNADLVNQMGSGAIVLACQLALMDLVETIAKHGAVAPDEAEKRAIAALAPGVILQPSGVFAALHAQSFGASYVKAS